jgi:hypothetical protein
VGGSAGTDVDGGAGGAGVGGNGGTGPDAGAAGSAGLDAGQDADASNSTPVYVNSCSHVHWTATASASYQGDVAAHAIDGYALTRWTTGRPQSAAMDSLQIDLGAGVTLSKIYLDNTGGSADDYPRAYSVYLSSNGVAFPTNAANGMFMSAPGPIVTISMTPQKARAVKIVATGTSSNWWSVHEVRFDCQLASPRPAGAVDPYDPADWKVSASVSSIDYPVGNAIDNDQTTRWSSGQNQAGGETFRLDLGAVTSVSEMDMDAGGQDFAAAYTLAVSTDGTLYEQVAAGTGAVLTQMTFAKKNARYLRVTQTGTDPNHWWSITEITIRP